MQNYVTATTDPSGLEEKQEQWERQCREVFGSPGSQDRFVENPFAETSAQIEERERTEALLNAAQEEYVEILTARDRCKLTYERAVRDKANPPWPGYVDRRLDATLDTYKQYNDAPSTDELLEYGKIAFGKAIRERARIELGKKLGSSLESVDPSVLRSVPGAIEHARPVPHVASLGASVPVDVGAGISVQGIFRWHDYWVHTPDYQLETIVPGGSDAEAAIESIVWRREEADYWTTGNRVFGTLGAIGSAVEVSAGAILIGTPTGVSQVAGVFLVAHGADQAQRSVRMVVTGQSERSGLSYLAGGAAELLGADPKTAELIGEGTDFTVNIGVGMAFTVKGLPRLPGQTRATGMAQGKYAAEGFSAEAVEARAIDAMPMGRGHNPVQWNEVFASRFGADKVSSNAAPGASPTPASTTITAAPRQSQIVKSGGMRTLDLSGQWRNAHFNRSGLVYVVRDKTTGQLLKVGQTTSEKFIGRFEKYVTSSNKTGRALEIDAFEVEINQRGAIEGQIRRQLGAEPGTLPWDNSGGRLGRPGSGTPSTPSATQWQVEELD